MVECLDGVEDLSAPAGRPERRPQAETHARTGGRHGAAEELAPRLRIVVGCVVVDQARSSVARSRVGVRLQRVNCALKDDSTITTSPGSLIGCARRNTRSRVRARPAAPRMKQRASTVRGTRRVSAQSAIPSTAASLAALSSKSGVMSLKTIPSGVKSRAALTPLLRAEQVHLPRSRASGRTCRQRSVAALGSR